MITPQTLPALPSDVWEQDVPVGGVDTDTGRLPRDPRPVVVVGLVTTRAATALESTSGSYAIAVAGDSQRLPRVPQLARRMVRFTSLVAGATCTLGDTSDQAFRGFGLVLVANEAPVVLLASDEKWIGNASSAGTLSWFNELHQG